MPKSSPIRGAREYVFFTTAAIQSCDFRAGAPGVRLAYYVAIFKPELQEHAPRTTLVLKSCDFQAGAAADQGGIEPATAGLRKQARKPRDDFQRPFREQEYCTAPQRERFDTHNLRRGFAETKTNSHGATATAEGRARLAEIVKNPQFLNLDHANLRVARQSCDFRAGAPGARFLCYGCNTKLRLRAGAPGTRGAPNAKPCFFRGGPA